LNLSTQPFFIDTVDEKETTSLNDSKNSKPNVKPVKSNALLIIRNLILVVVFILITVFGLTTALIGIVALFRDCYAPNQPSIGIWFLGLGGLTILLITVLLLMVSLFILYLIFFFELIRCTVQLMISITCQYKSSDKPCRVAFYIVIGITTTLLVWGNALVRKHEF
jgi:hypothetical protein